MRSYDNSSFYHSKEWKRVSTAYMTSRFYICERCGRPATICHHRKYLNGQNVSDPEIALGFNNLEALCQECHNQEHSRALSLVLFDEQGNAIRAKKGREEKQFESERRKIDELLEKMNAHKARADVFKE